MEPLRYHHLSKVKENATGRPSLGSLSSLSNVFRSSLTEHRCLSLSLSARKSCRHRRGGVVCRGLMLFGGQTPKGVGLLVPLGCVCCHTCTCGLSTSSSLTALYGDLILRGASCLDAFSTYPDPTRLPGGAPGGTTGSPVVGPTRSSRTSVGSSQISCAHNR